MKKSILIVLLFIISIVAVGCNDDTKPVPVPTIHTVEFMLDDAIYNTQQVEDGKLAVSPEDPTKEGFNFEGWFIDNSFVTVWDPTKPISSNSKIYAYLTPIVVELTTKQKIDLDAASIDFTPKNGKITLPLIGKEFRSRITWKSSDVSVLTDKGFVVPPAVGSDPIEVTLTGTFVLSGQTSKISFPITVEPLDPVVISTKKDIPFTNLTSEYEVNDSSVATYYSENGSIPYISVEDFLNQLDGLIYSDELSYTYEGDLLTISYEIEDESNEVYLFEAVLDHKNDTIFVQTLDFFGNYVQSTETNYSEGITYLESYVEDGEGVLFELSKYRFDMVVYEDEGIDKFLMPFHIFNTLFVGSTYYNVYYNVDGYYGVYGSIGSNSTGEDKIAYDTIKKSSTNSSNLPSDLKLATYDAQIFVLDYLYGLKSGFAIESFYENTKTYLNNFFEDTNSMNESIFALQTKLLDDLHTSYGFAGHYSNPSFEIALTDLAQLGSRVRRWYEKALWVVQDSVTTNFVSEDLIPPYRFLDNEKTTAVIFLGEFVTALSTEVKSADNDSDQYMKETLTAIFEASPGVKNIAVDLSYNTGGNLGALIRVLGYITEQPIEMSYQNPTDGSKITYFAEVETEAYEDINWFFLTSGVTFSAANLMTAIGKNQGFATIIGTLSGGGASSITPIVLPDGTFFTMSSLNVLSLRHDNGDGTYTYESIEYGITPDYVLEPIHIQTDSEILKVINQALQDQAQAPQN